MKRRKCSANLFRDIILTIIFKFEKNESNKDKKSELLKFYWEKNYDDLKVFKKEEIKELIKLYEKIIFYNINKDYNDVNDYEPLIVCVHDESSFDVKKIYF